MSKNKLLVIDMNNLIHRTWWSATNAVNHDKISVDDKFTKHLYYTINSVLSYVKIHRPSNVYLAWDERMSELGVNIRNKIHKDYKSGRSSDENIHKNNKLLNTSLGFLGFHSIYPLQLEADDIIAYICRTCDGHKVIVSGDKDFYQLINDGVDIYDPLKKIFITSDNFSDITGYDSVNQWYKCKCIQGDKSDNIFGVPRFGEVRSRKVLLGELKLPDGGIEIVRRNHSLFRLDKYEDVDGELEFYESQMDAPPPKNFDGFIDFCRKYNFQKFINMQTELREILNL